MTDRQARLRAVLVAAWEFGRAVGLEVTAACRDFPCPYSSAAAFVVARIPASGVVGAGTPAATAGPFLEPSMPAASSAVAVAGPGLAERLLRSVGSADWERSPPAS